MNKHVDLHKKFMANFHRKNVVDLFFMHFTTEILAANHYCLVFLRQLNNGNQPVYHCWQRKTKMTIQATHLLKQQIQLQTANVQTMSSFISHLTQAMSSTQRAT